MSAHRSYSAPAREEARRETRRRVRHHAAVAFLEHGYLSTTLAAVADAAGVSTRYVQMLFGSKAGLLSEVIQVAVAGDDEEQPVAAREEWATMLAAGGRDTLRAFAEINAEIFRRSAALLDIARNAAETDQVLAALQARSRERRFEDCTTLARRLSADGWLGPETTADVAADTIYALAGPETYLLLRHQRHLAHTHYAGWLTRTIAGALSP